jgi:HlyD family secretion protein
MSKKKKIGFGLIGLVLVIVAAASIYALKGNGEAENAPVSVERHTIPAREHIFVNGNIAPRKSEVFGLDTSKGTVHKIHVEDGQAVESGTQIVTYKREEVGGQIEELQYQLSEAKEAKKNQPAMAPEGEEGAGMPVATTDYDSQIKRLESQIADLKKKEYTTDTAGISGTVYIESVGLQEGMEAKKITVQGQDYVVKGTVNEKDVLNLKEGMEAEITIVSNEEKLSGKLESIDARPSTAAQSEMPAVGGAGGGQSLSEYGVVINIDNPGGIKEGFHVQAKIVYGEDRTIIPSEAIVKEGEKQSVYLIEEGVLKKKEIKTQKSEGSDGVVVTKGLKQGDEIVLNPDKSLKEGDIVE